ncbi:MAG: DUF4248 domain-containing protein [Parabacteroides gordonii]|nr:DUF4248 domain-containing protein [Parabacteroides gordonii]
MEEKTNYSRVWAFYELALCYFPESTPKVASERLTRWIRLSGNLKEKLIALDWKPGQKLLTPPAGHVHRRPPGRTLTTNKV